MRAWLSIPRTFPTICAVALVVQRDRLPKASLKRATRGIILRLGEQRLTTSLVLSPRFAINLGQILIGYYCLVYRREVLRSRPLQRKILPASSAFWISQAAMVRRVLIGFAARTIW